MAAPWRSSKPGRWWESIRPWHRCTILRTVKEHHLFAKGKQAKRQVLTRLLTEVGQLIVQTRLRVQGLGSRRDRVTQHA